MRIMFLMVAAALAFQSSGVQAQEACSASYVTCLDKCVARPSASLQESCMEMCQGQNKSCAAQFFGAPGNATVVATPPQPQDQPPQAQEALAANEETPAAKPAKPRKPAPRQAKQ